MFSKQQKVAFKYFLYFHIKEVYKIEHWLNLNYCLLSKIFLVTVSTHISCAVVSMSDYESAGLSLIPDEGSWRTVHPSVHPPKWIGR